MAGIVGVFGISVVVVEVSVGFCSVAVVVVVVVDEDDDASVEIGICCVRGLVISFALVSLSSSGIVCTDRVSGLGAIPGVSDGTTAMSGDGNGLERANSGESPPRGASDVQEPPPEVPMPSDADDDDDFFVPCLAVLRHALFQ